MTMTQLAFLALYTILEQLKEFNGLQLLLVFM